MHSEHLQNTIARSVQCAGSGVHSGRRVHLRIQPAPVNHGIKFVRIDLPHRPCVPARFNKVVDTSLATVIGTDGVIISTIEHLMAAFTGLGIDNALVEVDAYELPIMDGSAGPFVRLLLAAGIKTQDAPRTYFKIHKPLELSADGKFVGVYPAPCFRITCTIAYAHPLIGTQTCDAVISRQRFAEEIAVARTFGFLHEVEYMKRYGLAQGGSLDNAVVIGRDKVINPDGLRFHDEFVRHKLLDCVGDFSLLGLPIIGHVVARCSGHAFNHAFLERFFAEKDVWQTRTFEAPPDQAAMPIQQFAN